MIWLNCLENGQVIGMKIPLGSSHDRTRLSTESSTDSVDINNFVTVFPLQINELATCTKISCERWATKNEERSHAITKIV